MEEYRMPYDLESLKKDRDHVEDEIKIFKQMLLELMDRKIKLQALIENAEKRKKEEDEIAKSSINVPIDSQPTQATSG